MSWDRKRVHVTTFWNFWPMAKLVVKQSTKAHGPLVEIHLTVQNTNLLFCSEPNLDPGHLKVLRVGPLREFTFMLLPYVYPQESDPLS